MVDINKQPNYKRNHAGMTIILGAVSVLSVMLTMTGPPPFINKPIWDSIMFFAVIITTFVKTIQSLKGADAVQEKDGGA